MPRIAQYFEAVAPHVSSLVERYERARPRVISMVTDGWPKARLVLMSGVSRFMGFQSFGFGSQELTGSLLEAS